MQGIRQILAILHLATSAGNLDIIKFLLVSVRVDVNGANKFGLTALHCAAHKKNIDAFNLLVQLNADEAIRDQFQRSALDYLSS